MSDLEERQAYHCDLLVIGSGDLSAAVTAAWHGLTVVVAEKEAVFGGTTAWSGGWMWAPRNPQAVSAEIVEDSEAPCASLRAALGTGVDPGLSKADEASLIPPCRGGIRDASSAEFDYPGLRRDEGLGVG